MADRTLTLTTTEDAAAMNALALTYAVAHHSVVAAESDPDPLSDHPCRDGDCSHIEAAGWQGYGFVVWYVTRRRSLAGDRLHTHVFDIRDL